MKVAIHQPDFMPWLGFFAKISKADVWIVLDHVENNPRDAAFWGRRVRVLSGGEAKWFSVSLDKGLAKGRIGIPIKEMLLSASELEAAKIRCSFIESAYSKTPYFKSHFYLVEQYFYDSDLSLLKRNMRFINALLKLLDIQTQVVYSSKYHIENRSTQMLVDLLSRTGATSYLCGDGASGYQDDELLIKSGFPIEHNRFCPSPYSQGAVSDFVPGLSVLDSLFFHGIDGIHKAIENG